MKYLKNTLLLLILFGKTNGQQQNQAFTLKQAVDYALKNSPSEQNSNIDLKLAEYKRKEIAGLGLPQITGSFDFKDYFKIPQSIIDQANFGGGMIPVGSYTNFAFGLKYNATAGFNASQLLFSADYIFGLKAAKEFEALSKISANRGTSEVVAQVTKAYYGVLVNKERLKLLDANLVRLDKSLTELRAYNKQGLVELIDVERLEVANNNLIVEREKVVQLLKLGENLLKFQMGYKVFDDISLADSLDMQKDLSGDLSINSGDFAKRSDYQLLKAQENLLKIDVKRLKWGYLPTVAAYGAYQFSTNRPEANIFENDKNKPEKKWFPIALIGVTVNATIFDGFQRHNKIQQAKLNVTKNTNTLRQLELVSQLESSSAAITYNNALKTLNANKKNMELAKHVFEVTEKKFQQGVGSNLEIINAQTSMREAETNYYNALYDALISKTDYLKANGQLSK